MNFVCFISVCGTNSNPTSEVVDKFCSVSYTHDIPFARNVMYLNSIKENRPYIFKFYTFDIMVYEVINLYFNIEIINSILYILYTCI